ncbi:hypothetical protein MTR_8g066490 [Medicago truncatula]|uniref:Uncharacterized protein n=1 Tax=Medicago truncatula TaxID=3880 RepID=G7LGZ2_MEDTR|nr:hypothetical protein MTR_8g066490 [Medicago truncatula]
MVSSLSPNSNLGLQHCGSKPIWLDMWKTRAFFSAVSTNLPSQNHWECWWVSVCAYGCPMCTTGWA